MLRGAPPKPLLLGWEFCSCPLSPANVTCALASGRLAAIFKSCEEGVLCVSSWVRPVCDPRKLFEKQLPVVCCQVPDSGTPMITTSLMIPSGWIILSSGARRNLSRKPLRIKFLRISPWGSRFCREFLVVHGNRVLHTDE